MLKCMLDTNIVIYTTAAVGPLMRRKLAPWTEPLLAQIRVLRE